MADEVTTTGDSGQASSAPTMPTTAEGFFDAAKNQFFGGDDEQDDSEGSVGEEGTEGETTTSDDSSDDALDPSALGVDGQPEAGKATEAPKFAPYEFKGKVLGQEVAQKFESQKAMDRVIAQGLAAPQLYKQYQEVLQWKETVKDDIQYGQDLITMTKEDPKGLLDILKNDVIPQEVMADWVYEAYQDFKRLAEMGKGEREKELKYREAQRIIESHKQLEKDQEALKIAKQAEIERSEKQKFDDWHKKESGIWGGKVPPEFKASVKTAMDAVVAMARARIDGGQKVTYREMSQWLSDILGPAVNSKSPGQIRKDTAKALEDKKNQSTGALQRGMSQAAANPPSSQQKRPATAEDIFDQAKRMISQGRAKLRN